MGKIIQVRLTEYYPFQAGLTKKQQKMEGGTLDRKGKPLYSLDDYLAGKANYVSLACDSTGGPPANAEEFRVYGYRVWIPDLTKRFIGEGPETIEYRLVDTGGNFRGDKKVIKVAGYEPIDVCRGFKPSEEESVSGTLTKMVLIGPP